MKAQHLIILSIAIFSLVSVQAFATGIIPHPKTQPPSLTSTSDADALAAAIAAAEADAKANATGTATANGGSASSSSSAQGGHATGGSATGGAFSMDNSFNTLMPPQAAIANLVAMGRCWGSGTAGLSNEDWSFAFGKTYVHKNCDIAQAALLMYGFGLKTLAVEIGCGIDHVFEADRRFTSTDAQSCQPRKGEKNQQDRVPMYSGEGKSNYGMGVVSGYSDPGVYSNR